MTLDLASLMVMQSFATACVGATLILAWLQNRTERALAIWGLGDFSAAAGVLSLMFGAVLHAPAWSLAGGALLCSQSALIWKAVRTIHGKPTSLPLVLLGAAATIAAGGFLTGAGESAALAAGAVYTVIAAIEVGLDRRDRRIARWPLIGLMGVHAVALAIGIFATFDGAIGLDGAPALLSLFGVVYFENIVFTLGTAVFALALVKERKALVSVTAARTDELTGLPNRAAFLEKAERALEHCRRDGAPAAVALFDLDQFKRVNDQYGRAVGDTVLRIFCEVTRAVLRPADRFGRIGGEEFAIVMSDCGIEAAFARAERIRADFAEACRHVKATASGGVAVSATSAATLETLLRYSDAALYQSKSEGRNRIGRAQPIPPAETAPAPLPQPERDERPDQWTVAPVPVRRSGAG